MRLMKIKYPHNEELMERLHSCLDMCCMHHVIYDDESHYTIYIDKGKSTWKQVMAEVNRVHAVKIRYENDIHIENGKIHVDCGMFTINRRINHEAQRNDL